MADYQMTFRLNGTQQVPLWPLCAMIAALVVVFTVFRQGRQLWRRAWTPNLSTDGASPAGQH